MNQVYCNTPPPNIKTSAFFFIVVKVVLSPKTTGKV